jgi:hypothetical protein
MQIFNRQKLRSNLSAAAFPALADAFLPLFQSKPSACCAAPSMQCRQVKLLSYAAASLPYLTFQLVPPCSRSIASLFSLDHYTFFTQSPAPFSLSGPPNQSVLFA